MSSTATADHTATAGVDTLSTPERTMPSYTEVITAIQNDARCDERTAVRIYNIVARARRKGYTYLSDHEIETCHCALTTMMPDEVREPKLGSAHALMNERLLGRTQTFVHTKGGPELRYCTVIVDAKSL